MIKTHLSLLVLILFCLPLYGQAPTRSLNSASEPGYPPFSMIDRNGQSEGFSIDLLKAVAEVMDLDVRFKVDDWNNIKNELERGKIDVLPLMTINQDRERYFDFSLPYFSSYRTVFVRKDDERIQSVNDLRGKQLIVVKGGIGHEYLLETGLTDRIILVNNYEQAMKILAANHYDGVLVQKVVGLQLIKKHQLDNLEPVSFILSDQRQDFSFAVKEGNAKLLLELNDGLSIVLSNGTYERIHNKWFGYLTEESVLYKKLHTSLIILAILLLCLAIFSFFWQKALQQKVTEKTKRLEENQKVYRDFFDNSRSANVVFSPSAQGNTFVIESVNQMFEQIEGLSRQEVIGQKAHEVFHELEESGFFRLLKNVNVTGQSYHSANMVIKYAQKARFREVFLFKLASGELVASYQDRTKEKELEQDRINNYEKTVGSLVTLIEHRDNYTGGHSQRVAIYSKMVAEQLGLSESDCERIYRAGILHDIGKVTTPDAILLKPGRLNADEFELIQSHVQTGADMLDKIPMYRELSSVVLAHHERIDGSGYPNGLKGDNIPLLARIMAVCDAFDAMTTNRIYKGRKSVNEALNELESLKNIHYDSRVVEAANKVLSPLRLDESTSQFPESKLEQQRFAFFFKDQVTDAFNEKYLAILLKKNKFEFQYKCLNVIFLKNFTQYNESSGWKQGDVLLNEVSITIQQQVPLAMIFRLHGDDFIVMNKNHIEIDIQRIAQEAELADKDISLDLQHFHIKQQEISTIEALEEKIRQYHQIQHIPQCHLDSQDAEYPLQ